MTRRSRLILAAIFVFLFAGAWIARNAASPDVPTETVEPRRFLREVVAEGNLKAAKVTPVTSPVESDEPFKIAWIAPDGSLLRQGEVAIRFDPTDFERKLADGEADEASARHKIRKTDGESSVALGGLERDLDLACRERFLARTGATRDREIFSRNEIIEAEIDEELATAREGHAGGIHRVKKEIFAVDRELIGIDRKKADIRIVQAKRGLKAMEVLAPYDGLFVLIRNWRGETARAGQTVWPGQAIAEIPDLTKMEAEVWILEADAGGLAVGQKARVVVESRSSSPISATIRRVDTLARPRARGVPVQYFAATLELASTDAAFMKPGQRVVASLVLDDRAAVLSLPRQAVFERNGKKTVLKKVGRTFEPFAVELGSVALGRVEIKKGLERGDVVALRDPSKLASSGSDTKNGGASAPAPGGSS